MCVVYFMDIPLGVITTLLLRKCTVPYTKVTDKERLVVGWRSRSEKTLLLFVETQSCSNTKISCSFLAVGSSKHIHWLNWLFRQNTSVLESKCSHAANVYSPKHWSCRSFLHQLVTIGLPINTYNCLWRVVLHKVNIISDILHNTSEALQHKHPSLWLLFLVIHEWKTLVRKASLTDEAQDYCHETVLGYYRWHAAAWSRTYTLIF